MKGFVKYLSIVLHETVLAGSTSRESMINVLLSE